MPPNLQGNKGHTPYQGIINHNPLIRLDFLAKKMVLRWSPKILSMRNSSIFVRRMRQDIPTSRHQPNRMCRRKSPQPEVGPRFLAPGRWDQRRKRGTKGNRHQASLPPRLPGHFAPPIEACKVSRKEIFQKMLKGKKFTKEFC